VKSLFPQGQAGELLSQSFGLLAEGDAAGAAEAARQAAALDPDNPVPYRQWMLADRDGGRIDRYAAEVQGLLDKTDRPVLHYALALACTEQGEYSRAWDELARAGDSFAVHHARAELLTRTHQPSLALDEMQQAFRRASQARSLAVQMLELLGELGDWAALEKATAQVDAAGDGGPGVLLARAEALFRLGRRDQAAAEFQRLRQLEPDNGLYPGMEGWLYLLHGERGKAIPLLEQSLSLGLDPANREFFEDLLEQLGRPPGRRGGSWP
jgi:tetratricopeptide (TPR) repeat protein